MKIRLLSTILLSGSLFASAQTKMVADINPTGDSNPMWLTGFGNRVIFFADNGVNGAELMACGASDTAAKLIYDLNPGIAGSVSWANNRKMAVAGGRVFFPADNGNTGSELFVWGGVDSIAPALAAEINPSFSGSDINEMYIMGDRLYFGAYNTANGNELWSYNLTDGYTQRLTDLMAGNGSSFPANLIAYKDKLYFSASNGTTGSELYAYTPSTNTTVLVADIFTGISSSSPQGMTVINNKLYFSAYTATFGRELYSFDGTNLMRHTNVDNSTGDGVTPVNNGDLQLVWYKNKIYFAGNDGISGNQLWQFNPANGVASKVYDINPSGYANPQNFVLYGGKMFFSADDGTNGDEVWSYDGVNIPKMVADLDINQGSFPANFSVVGTNLYFSAYTLANGMELYQIKDSAALNVQNTRFDAQVKVFPNPTANVTTIQVSSNNALQMAYIVTDITGKVITRSDVKAYAAGVNNITVDLSNITNGIYQYRLVDAAGTMMAAGSIQKQ
jgi:ELWxxDGT repeat protein